MSTSPGRTSGSGISDQPSDAGLPGCSTVTAHMPSEGSRGAAGRIHQPRGRMNPVARPPAARHRGSMTPAARPLADFWPVFGLRLGTPRLTLAPLADGDLAEALELALAGIHAAEQMPFSTPWTDRPPAELVTSALQHWWSERAEATPERWALSFGVRMDGEFVGIQDLMGRAFAVRRLVATGSWLGTLTTTGESAPRCALRSSNSPSITSVRPALTAARSSTIPRHSGFPRSSATGPTARACTCGDPANAPWNSA